MRLVTFLAPGAEDPRAGEVRDGKVVAFDSGTVPRYLERGDVVRCEVEGLGAIEHAIA